MTIAAPAEGLIGRVADMMMGPRGCLFTFHRAIHGADWAKMPNRDFYVNLDFLDQMLGYLKVAGWDVVTISEAARRTRGKGPFRKFVNFSIDDCYRDTYEDLVPLFRKHGVPVTLFVTTGIPDNTLALADAGLEDALMRGRVTLGGETIAPASNDERRAAYARIAAKWDGADKVAHYRAFAAENGIDIAAMHWKHAITWDMLEELVEDPLVEIGSHTINHRRISALSVEDATLEMAGSRNRLEERLGIPVRHFAFPYGRSGDCGPRDFAIGLKAGYETIATTRKGLMRNNTPLDRLPRVTLNGNQQKIALIEAHLSGISAFLAEVAGRV
jgi:peptidoglycan/xylan/chitin deacetylase (PgdA/CDA1 family)